MRESFNSFDGDFDLVLDKAFAQPATPPDAADSPVRRASDIFHHTPNRLDSSEDSMGPLTPVDREYDSLGHLWDTLRQKKAKQMAKDPIKVKSLEAGNREMLAPQPISNTRHRSPRPSSPSTISQESPSNRRRYPEQPVPQMGMPGMSNWRERPASPLFSSPSEEVPKPEHKKVKKRKSMYAYLFSQPKFRILLNSLFIFIGCVVSHTGNRMKAVR